MTVHFFTFSGPQGGSSRQRAFRVVDELNKRGVAAVIHAPPVLDISRTRWPKKFFLIVQVFRALWCIQKGDIVYLQRAIANKYFFVLMLMYLRLMRRKMIFDFDDPVYLHSYRKTRMFCRMADTVITCTHVQATWARQFNTNVHVIHIALDLAAYEKFTKLYKPESGLPVVGWVGSGPEHMRNLELLASVFREMFRGSASPFTFTLVGSLKDPKIYDLFTGIPGLTSRFIDSLDWNNPESVPSEIQKFDIGVIPHQQDGEWNKAKSSFKVLEYMACGVATIASRFGEMPHIITDGVDGYLASDTDEWVKKLDILLREQAVRKRIGSTGQERIREAYCFDAIMPRLVDILTALSCIPNR